MGYAISWLAMQAPAAAARELLGLRPTGDQAELPEAPIVGAELSTGWYLIVADRCDHALIADRTLQLLSAKADVVACSIEEHVMFSLASRWSAAAKVWSVAHDAQQAIDHLEVSGELPAFASEIRDQCLARQTAEGGAKAGVDHVFEVPLETAQRIVGFKHDVDGEPARYHVLEPVTGSILTQLRPWWRFW